MKLRELLEGRESAWVVKARPDQNDLVRLLSKKQERWHKKRPPKAWLSGDLVFVWHASPVLAICGLAELGEIEAPDRDGETHFTLRSLTSYVEAPLSVSTLRGEKVLRSASFLKAGPAGTVFPLSSAQSARLLSMLGQQNPGMKIAASSNKKKSSTEGLALSIRQPWAERILRGLKTEEYRSFRTHKRGRVLVYASETKAEREYEALRTYRMGDLPTG